jgi:hypothetical protein
MKMGQPKLSEKESQRSGLSVQQVLSGNFILELMITEGNKQKSRPFLPCLYSLSQPSIKMLKLTTLSIFLFE